jgi:hypothetical protein
MVDLIVEYLEDTLEPSLRQAFEAHIADCQNCWRFLQTYRETIALGQQLRGDTIPPDMRERLEAFLRSRLPHDSSLRDKVVVLNPSRSHHTGTGEERSR